MTGHATGTIWFITGCTASGKSAVALELARRIGGEILAADSMQVYRGLDIGTAKPTPAEREAVPHHLLDLVGPEESFDAARWLEEARAAVVRVQARGRVPIFCGGTGLYVKAWFEGLDAPPPSDEALRKELEAWPLDRLLAELESSDPDTYATIDRQNPRRVLRAVEIVRLTGKPLERSRRSDARPESYSRAKLVALRREPGDLRTRVDQRVDAMFAAGLVDETRALSGRPWNRTAEQAIGYRQVLEHLRGERGLPDTIALVKQKTWQFARRQMTWFRHQVPVRWLDLAPGETTESGVERLTSMADGA